MRALVTGGAGFIGSHLVDRLLEDGHDVHVVDDFRRGWRSNLTYAEATGRCQVHQVDVTARELVDVLADTRPRIVFHLAAQIDVRASIAKPVLDAQQNVLGAVNTAEAARAARTVRKIVFASSGGAIYGTPTAFPVSEQAATKPESPYAISKICAELYLNMYRRLHGLDCTHLALGNIYGPRQDPLGEAGVVARFTSALLNGRPTTVFGDGHNTRDYVYVEDAVDAFLAASGPVGGGRRYNIGTGIQTSDRELHRLVADAVGTADAPHTAPARLGDVRASALDASAAARDLNWQPKVDLEEGVRRTVDYFRTLQ